MSDLRLGSLPDSLVKRAHRAPNNHLGRRLVQRQAGTSGPVVRYKPGTPEYDELVRSKERQGN